MGNWVGIRGLYQAANKVIERRPDVEDALAQEDAEANGRDGILDVVDDPRLLSVRFQNEIPLGAFEEHTIFGMQRIEVFLRPDHLRVNALHPLKGVRTWHDFRKPHSAISVKFSPAHLTPPIRQTPQLRRIPRNEDG